MRDAGSRESSDSDLVTLSALLTSAGDAIAILDPEGRLVEANDTLARRHGEPTESLMGRHFVELASPEIRTSYAELFSQARSTPGGVRWTSGHRGRVWEDALRAKPSGGFIWYGRDVTERQRAEEALETSDARFRLLAERSELGIAWFDERGLAYANPAFTELFGLGIEPLALPIPAEAVLRAVSPEDRELVRARWRPAQPPEGPSERATIRMQHPRAGVLIEMTTQGLQLPEGPVRMVSAHDVSDRRELFRRLLREEKEESLVAIAGGLAHDFNSILVGILSSVAELQDEVAPSRSALELCDIISTAARRMADMTGKLLMYSRGAPFRPSDIDFNQVVRDVVGMVWGGVPPSVRLVADMTPQRMTVRGDPSQLHQLVLTIVVNALEATETCGSTVTIETRAEPGRARLRVRDDGVGMDDDVRARLFDPFFTTKFEGRGLGLAAAKGILEAHGGQVSVESEPGIGSTFTIELPLSAPLTETTSQLHVVLLDPDPLIARLVARLLRRSPFVLDSFDDAPAFESRVRSRPHDIAALLVDRQLGFPVVKRLSELGISIPTIFLEAHHDPEVTDPSRLAKPFGSTELLAALYRSLGRTQRRDGRVHQAGDHTAG